MRNGKQATDWASVEFDFDRIAAARGNDRIYGTAGDDDLRGTRRDDRFDLSQGGDDVAHGGAGDDRFRFDETFDEDDRVFGGAGDDKVILRGDYSEGVVIDVNRISGIEKLVLEFGGAIQIGDGFERLEIKAGGGFSIDLDGSTLTSGYLKVRGSSRQDNIVGGSGADYIRGGNDEDFLTGGGGSDRFVYNSAIESNTEFGPVADTIFDFNQEDRIVLPDLAGGKYSVGQSSDSIGDIVLSYNTNSNRTMIEVFLDSDPAADLTLFLVGSYLDLRLAHGDQLVI